MPSSGAVEAFALRLSQNVELGVGCCEVLFSRGYVIIICKEIAFSADSMRLSVLFQVVVGSGIWMTTLNASSTCSKHSKEYSRVLFMYFRTQLKPHNSNQGAKLAGVIDQANKDSRAIARHIAQCEKPFDPTTEHGLCSWILQVMVPKAATPF